MLKSIHLKGYKAHRDTTVSLEPLTVFVGPNGSGKTSVLDACLDVGRLAAEPMTAFSGDHRSTRAAATQVVWAAESSKGDTESRKCRRP